MVHIGDYLAYRYVLPRWEVAGAKLSIFAADLELQQLRYAVHNMQGC